MPLVSAGPPRELALNRARTRTERIVGVTMVGISFLLAALILGDATQGAGEEPGEDAEVIAFAMTLAVVASRLG